jgi:hypothetical protein
LSTTARFLRVSGLAMTRFGIKEDVKKRQCVNKLAKYAKNPSPSQLEAAERVLLYVVTTKDVHFVYSRTLWYTPDGAMMPSNKIVVRMDASFANSVLVDECKSRSHC